MSCSGLLLVKATTAVILIVAAIGGQPYGFYTLLRWVVCPVCAYTAVHTVAKEKTGWAWTFGVLAALFNPLLVVHLGRSVWAIVDIAAAMVTLLSIWTLDRTAKKP